MPAIQHTTPRGGLEHRVFDGAGPADQLLAVFAFEPALTDAQLAVAQAELDRWSQATPRADAEEPVHCEEPFLGERTLLLRLHNVIDPRGALRTLQAALAALPLREAHFSRWLVVATRDAPAAVVDPDAPEELTNFPEHANYLAAVFGDGEPPASEYESQGNAAFQTRSGDIVIEERAVPLFLPPLRIGYGTVKASFTAEDERTRAVAVALATALTRGFSDLAGARVPGFSNRTGSVGAIDRLELDGRVGYGFALSSPELVQRVSVNRFRYREPEVFEALLALGRELGLAPIVTWQRFGKPFAKEWRAIELHVFQLWESANR